MNLLKSEKSYGIRPSEVAANKIQKHLQDLLTKRPKVYRRTLTRYIDLAYILLDCIDKILQFLTSELLSASSDKEFDELTPSAEDNADIMVIREKLQNTTNLLDSYSQLGKRFNSSEEIDKSCSNAEIIKIYGNTFSQGAMINTGYREVNQCADLINYWYTTRIQYMTIRHRAYQNLQIPNWVSYIVIMYGKAHANGTLDQFIKWFKSWCDNANNDFSNKYAVPKELTLLKKHIYPNDLTIDALIIYDILLDKCYVDLTSLDLPVKLDANFIVTLIKEQLPEYKTIIQTRFSKQMEYIEQINLTATSSVDAEVVDE